MLSANEFTVGSIGHASPLTLVLARHSHEKTFLVGGSTERPVALVLSEGHRFHGFDAAGNTQWSGLLIPGVRVEVDVATAFDASYTHLRPGAVLRLDTRLAVQASGFGGQLITLEGGLPATLAGSVCFGRWQIVLGSGSEKRVLYVVSIDETDEGS